jgi:hypothetical protein
MFRDPMTLLYMFFVAALGFALLYFPIRDALASFRKKQITSSQEVVPQAVPIAEEPPSKAKDAQPAVAPSASSDDEAWTPEEILRQLALVKKLNKDGTTSYLSKERMAALVGLRAEEARVIINEARGEPPPDALRVKDSAGERMIARV